jgi:flavin reductase (DIM6/NTAB) family NADH-FMN oxidoreductase RutF
VSLPPEILRSSFGLFATGVTVVSVRMKGEAHAMTANSFTSVSLDPPLILLCVGSATKIASLMEGEGTFVVNILSRAQQDLSTYFAGGWRGQDPPPYRLQAWKDGIRLAEAMAAFRCRTVAMHEAGDHFIVVGQVEEIDRDEDVREPLLFFGGRYGALQDEP